MKEKTVNYGLTRTGLKSKFSSAKNLILPFLGMVFLVFALGGCGTKEKRIPVMDIEEPITDTLILEKDIFTKGLGSNFNYFETDSGEILVTFLSHNFLIYDFATGKLLRKQEFEKEGPDGIGSFVPGSFIDEKGIYFLSQPNKFVEGDFDGKVHNRYDLPDVSASRLASNYSAFPFNPISKSGSSFTIADVPLVLKKENLSYKNWILKFNPEQDTHSHIPFSYPKEFLEFMDDPNLGPYNHLYRPEEDLLVVSFSISDSLLLVKDGVESWVDASVKENLTFAKGTTEQVGEMIAFHPNYSSGSYGWIAYDASSQMYLRLVKVVPNTEKNKEDGKKPLTKLVVLDKEFTKIGEVVIPYPVSGFSTPDGYFFNIGHQESEELVGFARVDFSKINP